ncbi:hypothetical protein NL676_026178 [Syzygium grande]|nr:hypothetical protein NL676_026178 [Syzygium grande]
MPRAGRFHPDSSSSSDTSGTERMRCKACEEKYVWRNPYFLQKVLRESRRDRRGVQARDRGHEGQEELLETLDSNRPPWSWVHRRRLGRRRRNGPNGGQSKPVPAHRAILGSIAKVN